MGFDQAVGRCAWKTAHQQRPDRAVPGAVDDGFVSEDGVRTSWLHRRQHDEHCEEQSAHGVNLKQSSCPNDGQTVRLKPDFQTWCPALAGPATSSPALAGPSNVVSGLA